MKRISTLLSLSILFGLSGCDYFNFKSLDPEYVKRVSRVPVQDYKDEPFGPYTYSLKYEDKLPKPVPFNFSQKLNKPELLKAESERYFEHLCNSEAGNYIWKTVKDVDSVALLRSTEIPNKALQTFQDYERDNPGHDFRKGGHNNKGIIKKSPENIFRVADYLNSPIALEAPLFFDQFLAGHLTVEESMPPELFGDFTVYRHQIEPYKGIEDYFSLVEPLLFPYNNKEQIYNNGVILTFPTKFKRPQEANIYGKEQIKNISSRYAITWRGFQRPRDREFGIAGSDMIIVDLKTNEVLAVHRNFGLAIRQFEYKPTRISWHLPLACFETYKNERSYQYSPSNPFNEKFKMMNRVTNEGILPPFVQNTLLPADPEKLIKVKPIINKAQ